ncbi:MAG: hypothetical protein BroJett040_20090 [Oligoflexia bacterium]|nr:MAG: hypothetical protein BroJett040_20090 [Oligoflexia bacterium]
MLGKRNLIAGFFVIGFFMIYGFLLVYLRDFAPGAADWAASYSTGKHFEARLAHVHGALFAFLNIMVGYLLLNLKIDRYQSMISWTSLLGLLMPFGILLELVFGAPPVFVLIGAASMTISMFLFGWAINTKKDFNTKE